MEFQQYKNIFNSILNDDMTLYQNQDDVWQLLCDMRENLYFDDQEVRKYAMKISKYTHKMASYQAKVTGSGDFEELYWKLLLLEAPWAFESYLYYMEKKRAYEKQFYRPREKTQHILAD